MGFAVETWQASTSEKKKKKTFPTFLLNLFLYLLNWLRLIRKFFAWSWSTKKKESLCFVEISFIPFGVKRGRMLNSWQNKTTTANSSSSSIQQQWKWTPFRLRFSYYYFVGRIFTFSQRFRTLHALSFLFSHFFPSFFFLRPFP